MSNLLMKKKSWTVAPLLAASAMAILAGCSTNRDSITVGSVPDDYRTNHPIVISEKQESLDLPVGASDRGVTKSQRIALEGFMSRYDHSASPVVQVMIPSGAANDVAASHAAGGIVSLLKANGVPGGRISVTSYAAGSPEVSAPVRVAYTGVKAHTDRCGRWPEDIMSNAENKHYSNFGCASQNNLAAQIANPTDLLGPRKASPIDAGKRGNAIEAWQQRPASNNQEVEY